MSYDMLPVSNGGNEGLDISAMSGDVTSPDNPAVFNYQVIPDNLDIYWRTIYAFVPEGKTLEELTPEERKEVDEMYRFSPGIPGIYQGITGFGRITI